MVVCHITCTIFHGCLPYYLYYFPRFSVILCLPLSKVVRHIKSLFPMVVCQITLLFPMFFCHNKCNISQGCLSYKMYHFPKLSVISRYCFPWLSVIINVTFPRFFCHNKCNIFQGCLSY